MERTSVSMCCPECGGKVVQELDCWWQMGAIAQWEFSDPKLYKLHFYTVACYNLQHPSKFTDDALEGLKQTLCEAFDKGWSNEQVRAHIGRKWDGKAKVLLKEPKTPIMREWSMTISDVYIPDQPEGAADRVYAWAKSVRNEL